MTQPWVNTTIGQLATVTRGASPRPIASSRWFDPMSHVRWVRIADVSRSDGRTLQITTQALSLEGIERSRFLPKGTLIMSIAATVGVPVITGVPACIHDGFVALEDLKVDQRFLLYLIKGSVSKLREAGQSGSQTNVNTSIVKNLEVFIPVDPEEQKRIANALWDTDDLIDNLRRLLVKKRAVKQGMMQRLLTGEVRLPGYNDSWKPLQVSSVSHIKARIGWQGLTTDEYRVSGNYRLVGGTSFIDGRIDWESVPFVDKWRYDQDVNIQLKQGDVLVTKDGTIGKVAYVDNLPGPTTLNSGVFVIRPKSKSYDSGFLFYVLRSNAFIKFVAGLSAGSTISHLYQRDLITLEFMVPTNTLEQGAIAQALFDADAEINGLEKRLAAALSIKQGMMQQLLTGSVRLIEGGIAR